MCGIAGFYNSSKKSEDYPLIIKRMLSLIEHRGPDEAGIYVNDHMAMGTVRLSIIDLLFGTQPLSDQSQRYWICYNGEIYNYQELQEELRAQGCVFQSRSDTEVVLQAWLQWKEECLVKFNGPFAFAIYDKQESRLFLARDRYGKRPLFYSQREGAFIFSSEMKGFLGYENFEFQLAPEELTSILMLWTPLPDQSGFKNIKQLPMGHYMTVKDKAIHIKNYTVLRFTSERKQKTETEAIDEIRGCLSESVKLRLRSDVEVGVYLSGGLDSAITTHLAVEHSAKQVHSFSVEFEEKEFDESSDQQELARYLGTNHTAVTISNKDVAENFPHAVYHSEVSVFRTAFVPMFLLSKKVQEMGIKVVLTGEGADETFLGYNIFKETLLRKLWNQLSDQERKEKLGKLYPYLDHFGGKNIIHLMGLYQQFSEEQRVGLFSHEIRFQNGHFSRRLLETQYDPFNEINRLIEQEEYYSHLTCIQKAQWLEFKTLLAGYLLSTQGDRMSLAHGVENRCPFLDPNILELSSAVNLKFDDGFNEKYLLKKAFETKLPDRTLRKNKHPYRAPESLAFIQHRPDYLELLLSEAELKNLGFLNIPFCQALIKKIFSIDPQKISTKENHTFIFLISLVLIYQFFIKQEGCPVKSMREIERILAKEVDERESTVWQKR